MADTIQIGVVAPGCRIEQTLAARLSELAKNASSGKIALTFHPQCFLSSGHFAGTDEARLGAFVEFANDERFTAIWFARGGYGSGRIAESALARLSDSAHRKAYLGYSDLGALMGAMYRAGFKNLYHAPMPADLLRKNGEVAVERVLKFLMGDATGLEPSVSKDVPTAAFNITILSHLIGTPSEPDLSGHVLMLEEVSEYIYRIDRALLHIMSAPGIRDVAGIRLGRCSAIPDNDPDFGQTAEEVTKHRCSVSAIPYLGSADIGHDIQNKIVPYGKLSDALLRE
jgi:muramoyltetrapeptide carboxypeptidase